MAEQQALNIQFQKDQFDNWINDHFRISRLIQNELNNSQSKDGKSKWSTEQKLQMLEHSATAMADDLVKKSNLIQFYCMEGKQGMDFLQKWFFKVLAALNDLLQESHL